MLKNLIVQKAQINEVHPGLHKSHNHANKQLSIAFLTLC